jgi:hypothetical protein
VNDVEKLRSGIMALVKNRKVLEDLVDTKLYLAVTGISLALDKVNLDEVTLDNFKPENSKCLLSQEELKFLRKELKETRDVVDGAIAELAYIKDYIENIYQRVDMSCID